MDVVLIFGAFALFVGGGILYSMHQAKKRREGFIQAAEQMGLQSYPDGDSELFDRFAGFRLFSKGRARKMKNVVQGDSGEVKIAIFDYQYTTGSGKQTRTHYQSVISLQSQEIRCPDFTMRPEGMLDKIGGAIGLQDIDFDSHPNFSKMFVLKSSNQTAIREYFKPPLLEFFETKKGISVEAAHGALFFYRPSKKISPEEIKDYLAQAYEVYGAMVDQ